MQRKIINQLPQLPASKCINNIKEGLLKLIQSVSTDKNLSSSTRQNYTNILKEIDWGLGKISPKWPAQVQRMMQTLKIYISQFDQALTQANNIGICGSSRAVKNVDLTFKNIIGFKQVFPLIGHYQDKNLKQELVSNIITLYEKHNPKQEKTKQIIKEIIKEVPVYISNPTPPPPPIQLSPIISNQQIKLQNLQQKKKCQYCQLYLSLSLQPNTYLAKTLLKKLPDTQWINGILYQQGKIFQRDLKTAVKYFQKAIEKNNADSLYRLGQLNQRGEFGKPMQYVQMWRKSAELGNLQAITDIGFIFQNGIESQTGQIIMEKDYNKAQQYYLKAAKQNFPRALNNLGSFYLQNPTFKNPDKSFQYFNKAIQAGYIKAMFNLGICYNQGLLKNTDKQKAKQLFKRGAQLGDHQSKLFYVDLLLNGDVAECSEDQLYQANQFCRQMIATQQQRAEAYYFLGIMYEGGLGVPPQTKTAFLYYLKSAKLEYLHAIFKLADWYRIGFGVQQDYKQSLRYYEQIIQQKPEVLVFMGMIYQEGSDEVKRNYERAYQYYYEACNKGIPEGFIKLGGMYKMGKYVKKDDNKAKQYLRKGQQLSNMPNTLMDKTNLIHSQTQMIQSSYLRGFEKNKKMI